MAPAPLLVLNEKAAITAETANSSFGNIHIDSGKILTSADSSIFASGVISYRNPPDKTTGGRIALAGNLTAAKKVARDTCAERATGSRSSL